jgi:hypothetical protein
VMVKKRLVSAACGSELIMDVVKEAVGAVGVAELMAGTKSTGSAEALKSVVGAEEPVNAVKLFEAVEAIEVVGVESPGGSAEEQVDSAIINVVEGVVATEEAQHLLIALICFG